MKDIIVKKYTPLEVKVTRIEEKPDPTPPAPKEPIIKSPIQTKQED